MTTLIQIRRGLIADLPTFNPGELGLATDTDELFIGTPTGNLKVYPPVPRGDPALFGTPAAGEFTYWHSPTEVTGLPEVTWSAGDSRMVLGASVGLQWTGKSIVTAPDNGSLKLTNSAANDCLGIFFGPNTVSFPYLKRDAAGFAVRTGNDGGYSFMTGSFWDAQTAVRLKEQTDAPATVTDWGSVYTKSADSHLYYKDSGGTEYDLLVTGVQGSGVAGQVCYWTGTDTVAGDTGLQYDAATDVLQWGGTTNAFPGLRRTGTRLYSRLADNSAYAGLGANDILLTGTGTGFYAWSSRSKISSPSDGVIVLQDNAGTDYASLAFGGVTSSYPALFRDGTSIEVRRADNSTWATLQTGSLLVFGAQLSLTSSAYMSWSGRSRMYSDADGDIRLTDNDGLDFTGVLQFGKTDGTRPGLKAIGSVLYARLADDSAAASIVTASASIAAAGAYSFITRSAIYSDADGSVRMVDSAGTDFDLLVFGQAAAGYVAWKRVGTAFQARLGDDSNWAGVQASYFSANTYVQAGSAQYFGWPAKSRLYSSADGAVELRDNANAYNATLTAGETVLEGPTLTTSAADQYGMFVRRTLNDPTAETGTQTFTLVKADLSITDSTGWDQTYLLDLMVDGVSKFRVLPSGSFVSTSAILNASGALSFQGRSRLSSPADDNLLVTNAAAADFGLFQFGGTGAGYPALKRVGTGLQVRLGDDSALSSLTVQNMTGFGEVQVGSGSALSWSTRARLYSTATDAVEVAAVGGSGTAANLELNEYASAADPAAPAANKARFYIRDNGAGKGQLCVRFATGAVQVIATEP